MEYKMVIHDVKDKLPLKSGTYLVKTSKYFNLWQVLSYSVKFKKFNTYDSQENDRDAISGYMWVELPGEDSEVERVTCPNCNGSGVYQECDEYDRYCVYACYKCEGTGEIARQSVKSEEVQEAIEWVEGTRRKAQKELDSLIETKSRYDHQIEIGDPWNWKWEESWHPLAVEGRKQTIKNANLAITALQAHQPVAISKTETTSCEWCEVGIDTATLMGTDMMMRFVRLVNYCPHYGRKLKENE